MLFYKSTLKPLLLSGIALLFLFSFIGSNVLFTTAATNESDIFVDVNTGADSSSCGSESAPCASIQYAVNMASSGQTIRVAAGTYTYNAANDTCNSVIGSTAVVCIRNKELTILGGFTANNWSVANHETNLTIIDGQNSKRGILVQHGSGQPAATLTMTGFTVQNGRAQGASSGSDTDTYAFGGGMIATGSTTILQHMVFKNNQALGGNTNSDCGGAGVGGGIALRTGLAGSSLEHVTFTGNQAIGGTGLNRGGFGIGGGLYTYETIVSASYITLTNNIARGGSSNGSGAGPGGDNADGQGGGIAFQIGTTATFDNITVNNNQSLGGNAFNGQGGGSFGGGIYAEATGAIELSNAMIHNNISEGGDGTNSSSGGSVSLGGGIATTNSPLVLGQASVINNRATGGDGTVIGGSSGGGGASFVRTTGSSTVNVSNSIFANNLSEMGSGTPAGGGGGGIYMRGATATIDHTTVAQNEIGSSVMSGNGILLISSAFNSTADISYSIIAEHTVPSSAAALYTQSNNTINLANGLFSGNNNNTGGTGNINGIGNMINGSALFKAPGAPDYDYHIQASSDATDTASGSSTTTDVDGDSRDDAPDIGADEYIPPTITAVYGAPNASSSVLAHWDVAYMDETLDHYEVVISCPGGASPPNEVACGAPLNTGTQRQIQLTDLTNFVTYTIVVRAYDDGTVGLLDENTATFTPTDIFVYLPTILRD